MPEVARLVPASAMTTVLLVFITEELAAAADQVGATVLSQTRT